MRFMRCFRKKGNGKNMINSDQVLRMRKGSAEGKEDLEASTGQALEDFKVQMWILISET